MTNHICFIGGGNMAGSLVGGLVNNGYDTKQITVTDPDASKLQQLEQQFTINTTIDNTQAVENADVIVLAVKPQVLHEVCATLKNTCLKNRPLIISIAAGI